MKAGEIAFRVLREAGWVSVTLSDLRYLSDVDLALQTPTVAAALLADVNLRGWQRDETAARWVPPERSPPSSGSAA